MPLAESQLAILKTELDSDPKSLGYAGKTHPETAALLNTMRATESVDVGVIDGQELSKAVVISEYTALTDSERQGWTTMLAAGGGQVDIDDERVIDQATAIWDGTTTLANLNALRTRDGSRSEALFGNGVAVTSADVMEARLL